MKTSTAKQIIADTPLTINDIARLALEMAEQLGERLQGLNRQEMISLFRKAGQLGVAAITKTEHTVSFETAAWDSVAARQDRRPTTLRDLRYVVGRILRKSGAGKRPLRAMNTQECRDLLQESFGHSISGYRKARSILHSIFAHGFRREWCDANPVDRIDIPRIREKQIIPLNINEIKILKSTVDRPEHRPMRLSLHLMLYCGIRPAEVARLKPEDILWKERQVIIRPNTSKTGGGRIVPLRNIGSNIDELKSEFIPRNWALRWRALRKDAGFTNWIPDTLRHTFASYHAARFRNLAALQLEMGHRDASLLQTRYVTMLPSGAEGFWNSPAY